MAVSALCLFLTILWVGLQSVIVPFLGHIDYFFGCIINFAYQYVIAVYELNAYNCTCSLEVHQ